MVDGEKDIGRKPSVAPTEEKGNESYGPPPRAAEEMLLSGRASGRVRPTPVSPGGEGATGGTEFGPPGPSRLAPGGVPDRGLLELADSLQDVPFPASRQEIVEALDGQYMSAGDRRVPMSDLVRQLETTVFDGPDEVVRGVSGLADFLEGHGARRERSS